MIFKQIITLTQEENDSKQSFLDQIESLEKQGCSYVGGYPIDAEKHLSEVLLCKICEVNSNNIDILNEAYNIIRNKKGE